MALKLKIPFILVLLIFYCSFTGCSLTSQKDNAGLVTPQGVSSQPAILPEFSQAGPSEGSLWVSKNGSIFEDSKAAHVGDTVIIDIIENTTSKMDVNTEASRESKLGVGVPHINLFGNTTNFGGAGDKNLIGADFLSEFEAEADSDRSGQITASIAARITEVLPNGNLSIFGRRAMKVNEEVQYITVAGIVRPQDISATNRIKSTFLADSRIEYYGKGALADKQKPGWGTRLLDNLWPW